MDDLLTTDDFEDIAAAVGEGGDVSDDDARSDDFLSWLLVHADSIDPKLDDCSIDTDGFDHTGEVAVTGGAGAVPAGDAAAPGGGFDPSVADHYGGFTAQSAATNPTQSAAARSTSVLSSTEESAKAWPQGNPGTATTTNTATDNPGQAGTQGNDRAAAGVGVGTVAGGTGISAAAALLQTPSLAVVGGIPSDPVLAMQMGARMALTGNLNLIPFGLAAGAEGNAGGTEGGNTASAAAAAAATAAQARPQLVDPSLGSTSTAAGAGVTEATTNNSVHPPAATTTATAAAAGGTPDPASRPGVLPAWTGLPHPPVWLKTEERGDRNAALSPAYPTPAGSFAGGGAGWPGAGGRGPGGGGGATAWSGGSVGKKRPRTSAAAPDTEGAAGGGGGSGRGARDAFKDGRKRKKMSLGELEERVKQVSEDNERLKLHLSNVNDKLVLMASKKKLMEAEIAAKLEAQRTFPSTLNQESLDEALSRFKDLYADYGKQRKQEVEFHLKQLERQIVPTDTTKMSLWTLEQDESFYKDRKRGSLSLILRTELGVSEEQIERIQERRTRIKGLLNDLGESLRLVRDLQHSFEAKNAKFEEVMARLQSAFSPQQVARLLLWVSANRAHISKLPLLPKQMLQRQ